jgi:hypothetical protein
VPGSKCRRRLGILAILGAVAVMAACGSSSGSNTAATRSTGTPTSTSPGAAPSTTPDGLLIVAGRDRGRFACGLVPKAAWAADLRGTLSLTASGGGQSPDGRAVSKCTVSVGGIKRCGLQVAVYSTIGDATGFLASAAARFTAHPGDIGDTTANEDPAANGAAGIVSFARKNLVLTIFYYTPQNPPSAVAQANATQEQLAKDIAAAI